MCGLVTIDIIRYKYPTAEQSMDSNSLSIDFFHFKPFRPTSKQFLTAVDYIRFEPHFIGSHLAEQKCRELTRKIFIIFFLELYLLYR